MIKFFALLILATAICEATLTENQQSMFTRAACRCAVKLRVPLNCVRNYQQRMRAGDVDSSDTRYKNFVVCHMRELGMVHENGTAKRQTVIDMLAEGHDRKLVEEVVQECDVGVVEGVSADDTVFNQRICFWAKKKFQM